MLRLRRLFSLVCFVLAVLALSCVVLPQQAEAQNITVSIMDATADEGDDVVFTLELSASSNQDLVFEYSTIVGGIYTASENDIVPVSVTNPGSVTIRAGDRSATISIGTRFDVVSEPSKTFLLGVGAPHPSGIGVIGAFAIGTIRNVTPVRASISNASAPEGDEIVFTAELDIPANEDVQFRVSTGDVTAGSEDYRQLALGDLTITIPEGDLRRRFGVSTTQDDLDEGDEIFTVNLTRPAVGLPPRVMIANATAIGRILDDDDQNAVVSITGDQVFESEDLVFTVSLDAALPFDLSLIWSVTGGTATGGGVDFGSSSIHNNVIISEGERTASIRFETVFDDDIESPESVMLTLGILPTGITSDSPSATGMIMDHDATVSIVGPVVEVAENVGTANFPVRLSKALPGDVIFDINYNATTADLETDLGTDRPTTVTITEGNTEATIMVPVIDDEVTENTEIFFLELARRQGSRGVTIEESSRQARIFDNDVFQYYITPSSLSVEEDEEFVYTVNLSQPADEDISFSWTVDTNTSSLNPVISGDDLEDTTGTVTIDKGDQQATFTIPIKDDELIEPSEIFRVGIDTVEDLPDGLQPGQSIATGTITDDDTATVSIETSATAAEGSPVEFAVNLSAAAEKSLRVRWTATVTDGDGAATLEGDGADLGTGQVLTGVVVFGAEETTQTVRLATVNDDRVEGSETFTVTLSPDDDNPLPENVTILAAGAAGTGTITEDDMATVSIAPEAETQTEGDPFAFEVRLSAPVNEAVSVTWTAVAGTAAVQDANSDLAASQDITGTATFAAGTTTAVPVPINILDDDVAEGEEAFTVTLTGALPDGVEFGAQTATATITDNDAAELLIETSATAAEGSAVEFDVSLNAASMAPVTVRWTLTATGDSAATLEGATSDLGTNQDTSGTVEFSANDTADKTVSIATADDDRVEGSETFTVTLSPDDDNPLPGGVSISPTARAGTGTITEDDAATVSLSPLSPSEAEGGTFTFTAMLSASVSESVTVRWTASSGTATVDGSGSDLASGQAATATVTFPANSAANATQTFTITTANDDRVEGSETFTVTLSPDDDTALPDGVTVGTDDEATATITETDAATVSLSPLSPSVAEGGTFTFTATLSASVSEAVTVRWTATDGTATVTGAGSDLGTGQATTATVTFPADSAANATQTFMIATNNDTRVEGSETFTVSIAVDSSTPLPDGVEIGTDDEATATITEDETATVSLSPLSPSATEGGTFTFTATLSASVSEAVTVRWTAADGTATVDGAGSDLASGQAITATVVFPANSAVNATQTFMIATANDVRVEGSETFTVTLSPDDDTALPDGVTVGTDDEATATITETDAATVSLSPLSPSVAEGGTFTFTATLSASVSEAVTVRWTATDGTATVTGAGSDLGTGQATTATVTFPADSAANATQTFMIATNNDTRVEGSETFTVSIAVDSSTPLPDGVEIGTDDEATATITEDETATVSLSPLSPSATEGGTFTFTATLSASVSEAVTVRWTAADGTATVDGAGSDLATGQAITATVVFPANSAVNATQTFMIATANDVRVEGSETFTVTLSPDDETVLPDGVTVGADDEATATITETDAATVTLSPLSPSVAEGGTFTFTATLSASVSEAVTVRWTAASGTATVDGAGSDLASGQATTATVTFPADSAANATQTFTIATNNDTRVEGSETFTVSIAADSSTPLPDGVEIGTDDEAAATITEDETATVSLSPLSPSAAEGGTFTFTATLSASVSESVTARWTAASGTATVDGAGSDLASGQAVTATVTFPADSAANATQTFMIATANDARVEGSETFTVTLSEDTGGGNDLPDGVEIGTDDEATATITEDETATVSLSPLSPSAAEGGTFTFTATLSAPVSEAVTVRWTAASGTATVDGANSDLASGQATTATVEFPVDSAANATQTFMIVTANDVRVEGSETFTVTLSPDDDTALPDGVTVGTDDEATATITETDAATVSLSPLSPSAAEGGTFTFTATLSASVSEAVTVRWTATDGTATVDGAGSDLASGQATTATVTFPADSAANATQTFTIATNNDDLVEGSETFMVTLGEDTEGGNDLPDGVEIGTDDEATAMITEDETATVSLSPLSPSAAEGGTFTFTATLSASVSESVTVRWTAASGTATVDGSGSDLGTGQATTATVEFPADSAANATQTFMIATNNDTRVEGSETFTVTLAEDTEGGIDLPDGVEIGSADEATATITEDETATVTLSPLSPSAAEGGTFTFTATLSASVSESVTVRWTAAAGTATVSGAGSDLASGQATTATVEFPADSAANATQTFMIATNNDTRVEGSETFTVTLAEDTEGGNDLPDGVEVGADDEATATITEDDAAELSITDGSGAEGSSVVFEVSLSAATMEGVTVRWTATTVGGDGAATLDGAGSDLASGEDLTGTVVFGPNDNAVKTVSIATVDDALVEGDETFTVTLSPDAAGGNPLPDGVTIPSAGAAATGTITEDDMATVSIAPEADTQTEGGSFAFEVRLSAPVDEAVNVTWTAVAGTAAVQDPNSDLATSQDITGTATFAPGTTTAVPIPINTLDDDVAEGEEAFTVTLTGTLPDGVEYGTQTATATITDNDDDEAVTAVVSLSPQPPSVAEGGTFTFTVALSAASSLPVTVRWTAASGIARVDGRNSDLANGQATTGTVVFQANSTAPQTFMIATRDDAVAEGPETFTVSIDEDPAAPLPTGVTIDTSNSSTATITDAADAATVSIAPADASVAEGDTFAFEVRLSAPVDEAVSVTWTAMAGTAAVQDPNSDLADGQDITGTATFTAGTTTVVPVAIATVDDDRVEGEEAFTVTLTGTLPGGVDYGTQTATATITDNDEAPPPPPEDDAMVRIEDMTVGEAAGNAIFTVRMDQAVNRPVVLAITYTDGSAEVTTDLGIPLLSTVMIAANTIDATIAVPIIDDDRVEGEETFTVSLSEPRDTPLPAGVTIADGEATGTITDNDAASASIAPTAAALEGEEIGFKVQLDNPLPVPMTLSWTAEGSGEHPATADDLALNGTVTIPAQATEAMLLVATTQDVLVEPDETFTVTLGPGADALPPGMTITKAAYQGTGTILNDDEPLLASIEDTQAEEGEVLRFKVKLDRPTPERFTLRWSTLDGTALAGEDYEAVSDGTVVFAIGASTADLTVSSMEDQRIEEDEYFEVVLSTDNLPLGVEVEDGTATGTIENDDVLSVLLEPRRTAAMSALRRHVSRFEQLTSRAAHNRLSGRGHGDGFGLSENLGSGDLAKGADFGNSQWSGWLNGAYVGFDGESNGQQADLYMGVDHASASGNLVWGVLLGRESARLEVGEANYESDFLQWGAYGGVRLSESLIWDGAVSYGTATPHIRVDDIFADYDAQRFVIRTNLTGTYDLLTSGALTVSPQLGILYARERLGSFFDSVGGIGPREVLELGRISAGPRFTWRLPPASELVFGARFQWDMLRDAEGRQTRLSGAMDLGARFSLTPKINIGIFLEADGIGNEDEFATYGGRVEIDSQF